ncbi:TPA: hypothetical protein ACJL5J_002145 [Neisseria meningitidis]
MKPIYFIIFSFLLTACVFNNDDYFAEPPTPYLINEHGFYMNKKGDLIRDSHGNAIKMTEENKHNFPKESANPYYEKWIKQKRK